MRQIGRVLKRYFIALSFLMITYPGFSEKTNRRFIPTTGHLSLGEHSAEVNNLTFHYFLAGHGPLLVVQAPGWGIGSVYLQNGLAPLEEHFTLLFYDPRGSGASSRPSEQTQMSTTDMEDDLEKLRQYWGLETFDLIGHSQGASIALGYAARFPNHVRSLALVESSLLGFDSSAAFKSFLATRRNDPRYTSSITRLKDSFHTDAEFKQYFEDVVAFYLYDPTKSKPPLLKTIPNAFSMWAYFGLKNSNALHPIHQETELSQVRAKTLILGGADDPFSPVVLSERIHAGIPSSELTVLEESGQFPWIEQPTKFFESISHFFGR